MRQYAGFATAADSNERYHQLIQAGTTGLSVAFDLPTQMGYDSDAPAARGEVGKVGVAIDSIDDMRSLLRGIPLESVSVSMTINAPASVLLLLYQLVADEQGVGSDRLTGTIQNDILKEYIARGTDQTNWPGGGWNGHAAWPQRPACPATKSCNTTTPGPTARPPWPAGPQRWLHVYRAAKVEWALRPL